jgi:hypothetical protein
MDPHLSPMRKMTLNPSLTIVRVDAGSVNAVEDEVCLEDVRDALVPEAVTDAVKGVLSDAKVEAGARGAAIGLLASAADEAAIGGAVAKLVIREWALVSPLSPQELDYWRWRWLTTIPIAHKQKSYRQKRSSHHHQGNVTIVEAVKELEGMIPKQ